MAFPLVQQELLRSGSEPVAWASCKTEDSETSGLTHIPCSVDVIKNYLDTIEEKKRAEFVLHVERYLDM